MSHTKLLLQGSLYLEISLVVTCPGHYFETFKNCKWLKKLSTYKANDHVLQSFKVIFLWQNKFLSVCWPVKKRFQTEKKNFFSEVVTRNSWLDKKGLLFPQKNVALRLEFALFGSNRNKMMVIDQMHPPFAHCSIYSYDWSYNKFFLIKLE